MHGVKRDRGQLSAELKAQRKEKEAKKLEFYKSIEDQFFAFKKENVVTSEALELTTHLLRINPELYTAWNYRRKILESLCDEDVESEAGAPGKTEEEVKDFFASARSDHLNPIEESQNSTIETRKRLRTKQFLEVDLDLTIEVLRVHPKVYWIWNHRKWCLQRFPSDDEEETAKWKMEIQMVNKMLDMDARNFHGWNYRRFILTQLALPKTMHCKDVLPFPNSLTSSLPEQLKSHQLKMAEEELAYTLSKIESNFSNFSAWHHRSLLLEPIWTAKSLDEAQRKKERDEEFELVRQAMFVDPDDQSVWTYHSWLIGLDPSADVLEREIVSVRELLELEPESKWCMISLAECLSRLEKSSSDEKRVMEYHEEATILMNRLIEVDPDRKERYRDMLKTVP